MVAKQRPARFTLRILTAALAGIASILSACGRQNAPSPVADTQAPAVFSGGDACAQCHAEQADRWAGSHHDLAMQVADDTSVLGDFDNTEFSYAGRTTRFFRRDGAFVVSTEGADGVQAEFTISHAFGVDPLQQYLIELEDGKVQAFSIAWDSRPESEGGQRWFHLYPGEAIDYRDPLHWTGVYLRWNTMCADCHSTGLEKRYDAAQDQFATRWSAIDVGCEACHGPGSLHVADPSVPPPALPGRDYGWVFAEGENIASRLPALAEGAEAEVCASCHSLRTQLADAREPQTPFLDTYRLSLLDAGNYHADGQIQGEVYVYGSFLQSAMAAAGVTCSDCHEPHSTRLRANGNALCGQCHRPSAYDVPEHHRHESGSAGSWCVDCHMRSETYMVVDPRRDHSFRVPRPDLSMSLGSPNACGDCHADRSNEWAAAQVAEWFPEGRHNEPHFGVALEAGRRWAGDARERLIALIADSEQPAIARATALGLLPRVLTLNDADLLSRSLEDASPLVRLAAIDTTIGLPPEIRIDLVQRFLSDDRLALRIAAARALAAARSSLSPRRQADLDAALDEYLAAQALNSDRPEGVLNAAALALEQGRSGDVEAELRAAIARFPFEPALRLSLAEVLQDLGRADEAIEILRASLETSPDDAATHLALGFALVLTDRPPAALDQFEAAAAAAPDQPDYQYVLAIAHNDNGNVEQALEILRSAYERFPAYSETLYGLATMLRDAGASAEAVRYARELVAARPGDRDALELLRELEQRL